MKPKQDAAVSQTAWMVTAVLCVLMALLYYRVAIKLVSDWWNIGDDSAGLLIPFFVLFLLWDKREALLATSLAPSWKGLGLVLLGFFVLVVGVFGADLFLSRISFLLLVIGIVWMLLGLAMVREIKFILFVCLLAIPLPVLIMNHITFPLQMRSSELATGLLQLVGVPVLREGNVIQLPAMQLEVAEACSGIRSLMSLFTVAVIYGYFIEKTTLRRVILALAAIPIAVAANAARIFGTGLCVQYWDPDKAQGFFHEFSGWLMFLVSLSLLYLVHIAMRLVTRKRTVAA
ncbi:MAG TPA: exosortase [Acidobacteriaceae bacterium]